MRARQVVFCTQVVVTIAHTQSIRKLEHPWFVRLNLNKNLKVLTIQKRLKLEKCSANVRGRESENTVAETLETTRRFRHGGGCRGAPPNTRRNQTYPFESTCCYGCERRKRLIVQRHPSSLRVS